MASIYISLNDDDGAPTVETLQIPSGERFMNLRIGDACVIALPGYDHVTVTHAFALADAIRHAADALLERLATIEPATQEA